jgi:hypothetical protein
MGLLPISIKDVADRLLLKILLEDGMNEHRANLWFDMVQAFGKDSCKPGSTPDGEKVYTAP